MEVEKGREEEMGWDVRGRGGGGWIKGSDRLRGELISGLELGRKFLHRQGFLRVKREREREVKEKEGALNEEKKKKKRKRSSAVRGNARK